MHSIFLWILAGPAFIVNNNFSGAPLENDECSICSTKEIQKRRVTCTKCASDWCVNCYISIFRTNKGIIKCPFCRFAYGEEFPECMVEIGVQQILDSL